MLKIRLARGGAKKRPYYSIVVADNASPRDTRFLEKVGSYRPLLGPDANQHVTLKVEAIKAWLDKGAQPTSRVANFLIMRGLVDPKTTRLASAKPKAPQRRTGLTKLIIGDSSHAAPDAKYRLLAYDFDHLSDDQRFETSPELLIGTPAIEEVVKERFSDHGQNRAALLAHGSEHVVLDGRLDAIPLAAIDDLLPELPAYLLLPSSDQIVQDAADMVVAPEYSTDPGETEGARLASISLALKSFVEERPSVSPRGVGPSGDLDGWRAQARDDFGSTTSEDLLVTAMAATDQRWSKSASAAALFVAEAVIASRRQPGLLSVTHLKLAEHLKADGDMALSALYAMEAARSAIESGCSTVAREALAMVEAPGASQPA